MKLDRIFFIVCVCSVVAISIYVSNNPFWIFALFFLLVWPIVSVDSSNYIDNSEDEK